MRKILSLVVAVFAIVGLFITAAPTPARAELKIDIIAGDMPPVPIAIQAFESSAADKRDAAMLRDVVAADLKSTGLFHIVNIDAHPEFVKMNEMPKFTDWAAIKAQVLVQAKLETVDGKYKLKFYVWDIQGREQIEAQELTASKKSARRLSHIMADAIYERLTGEMGYFDTQIAFIAETGDVQNRTKRLAIMDSDGYGLRYVSDGRTMMMSPHFSPNMHTLVFLSYRDEVPTVWSLDMVSGEQRRLGKFGGMTFAPRFSPDGSRVALSMTDKGATNIYEYDIDGKVMRQLTFGDVIDTSPSYSPDGKTMAFNSNRSGSQQIHVLDLKTLAEKRLTFGTGRYATPAYSPDGKFVAFTKIANDTFMIGTMSPTGKNERIIDSGWYMEAPSWAPGSRRLVYYKTEKTDEKQRHSKIASVDIMGQNGYELPLPDGVSGVEPTWSPRLP